jgi:hypothetical protein
MRIPTLSKLAFRFFHQNYSGRSQDAIGDKGKEGADSSGQRHSPALPPQSENPACYGHQAGDNYARGNYLQAGKTEERPYNLSRPDDDYAANKADNPRNYTQETSNNWFPGITGF